MFCISCGKQLLDGDGFCAFCGARVEPPPEENAQAAPEGASGNAPVEAAFAPEGAGGGGSVDAAPASESAGGSTAVNYIQEQVRRVSRNRIILFSILSAFGLLAYVSALAASNMSVSDVVVASIFLGIPALLFLLFLWKAIRGYSDYTASSVYKKLRGLAGASAEAGCALLNSEVGASCLFAHKRLTLTPHWICIQNRYSLRILPAANLVWAYTYVLNGTFYQVVFALSNRSHYGLHTLRKRVCEETLTGVARSYPNVMIGFSPVYRQMYYDMFRKPTSL